MVEVVIAWSTSMMEGSWFWEDTYYRITKIFRYMILEITLLPLDLLWSTTEAMQAAPFFLVLCITTDQWYWLQEDMINPQLKFLTTLMAILGKKVSIFLNSWNIYQINNQLFFYLSWKTSNNLWYYFQWSKSFTIFGWQQCNFAVSWTSLWINLQYQLMQLGNYGKEIGQRCHICSDDVSSTWLHL